MEDFTTLKNNPMKFDKKISVFDIRDAINEISDMMQDKVQMKTIKYDIKYSKF